MLDRIYSDAYPVRIGATEISGVIQSLIEAVETDDESTRQAYRASHERIGAFFDAWFGKP